MWVQNPFCMQTLQFEGRRERGKRGRKKIKVKEAENEEHTHIRTHAHTPASIGAKAGFKTHEAG